jgi:hypothetical protein
MKHAKTFRWLLVLVLALAVLAPTCGGGEEDDTEEPTPTVEDDDDDPNPMGDDDGGDDDAADDDDDSWTGDDDVVDDQGACDGWVEAHEIVYAPWEDLPAPRQNDFVSTFGNEQDAAIFYARFAYWYGIAREAMKATRAYYLYDATDYPGTIWDENVMAAEMAFAYYNARGELSNVYAFHGGVVLLHEALTSPVPAANDPKTFFNGHTAAILANAEAYLWYQTLWAKDAGSDAGDAPTFPEQLAANVCGAIDSGAAMALQQPHVSFDANLPPLVFDAIGVDLKTWDLRLNPELTLTTGLPTGLIVFE